MTKIVCISDTHSLHQKIKIPDGDILIHAGDFCNRGTPDEVKDFFDWFTLLPHRIKICIAGNHDWHFELENSRAREKTIGCIYLQDSELVTPEGLKIYGSPWQPEFCDWAFNLPRGNPLKEKWDMIPADTDILVTHGPPYGIMDRIQPPFHPKFEREGEDPNVGCKELLNAATKIKLMLHVFGHIHSSAGICTINNTIFVNAAICDEQYNPINPPIVIEL